MDELSYMSASEALGRFRNGSLSPVEMTEALIQRAENVEPTVHAFTYTYFEEALRSAKEAEAIYGSSSKEPRALEGLCVAIKDSGHVAGKPTSSGSLTTGNSPQTFTSPINEHILDAGAIMHARSAAPEFSCAVVTHSRRWGVTRNPWNIEYTPGGSSGGAGASLASGTSTLASGSDIAGSIRIPAACCGVVGYKPPKGRTPVDAPFHLDPYCHTGPMARTVEDCLLFQNAISGPHKADPTTIRPKITIENRIQSLKGKRIAWSMDLGFVPVSEEIKKKTKEALSVFEALGCELVEINLAWTEEVLDAAMVHLQAIFGNSILSAIEDQADQLTPYAKQFAFAGREYEAADIYNSMTVSGEMARVFGDIMKQHDLFVCPTTALPSIPAEFDQSLHHLEIDGQKVHPLLGWLLTYPFNMLSPHPVLAVQSGLAENRVPTSIQIVGQTFSDQDVFDAGLAYEHARGPWFLDQERSPLFDEAKHLGANSFRKDHELIDEVSPNQSSGP